MNYWKVIFATVVIFGAGVLTGGLMVNFVVRAHPAGFHHPSVVAAAHGANTNDPPRLPEVPLPRLAREMGRQFVQQLNETLKLTPEQREKIEKIIAGGQEQNREIWTNVAPKMRAVIQEVDQQIRAELAPAQLAPFEALLKHPPHRPTAGTNAPAAAPTAPPPAGKPGV